jgi:hypothetical protein
MKTMYNYTNITAAAPTTTICASRPGSLGKIIINKATASAVIIAYDDIVANASAIIATITLPGTLLKSQDVLEYDIATKRGLTIVTSTGACDLTIAYK